jgi:DNA adenine methylase
LGFINNYSPLRYPGGKAAAADFFAQALRDNKIGPDGVYCEPFAGGAGVALTLLITGRVEKIVINDLDPCVAAFWNSLLENSEKFIENINKCIISINAWKRYRSIYDNASSFDLTDPRQRLKLGFATFFLNRTNRGGILPFAGPIGGREQSGKYKIDARFRKDVLIERLKQIVLLKDKIVFFSKDAFEFLDTFPKFGLPPNKTLMYLDPPYYKRGKELYLNFYSPNDHILLAERILKFDYCKWLMTYDDCQEIRNIYDRPEVNLRDFYLQYSIQRPRKAVEIMIAPKSLVLPSEGNNCLKQRSCQ